MIKTAIMFGAATAVNVKVWSYVIAAATPISEFQTTLLAMLGVVAGGSYFVGTSMKGFSDKFDNLICQQGGNTKAKCLFLENAIKEVLEKMGFKKP